MARCEVRPSAERHRDFHQRRRGGESIRGDCRSHTRFSRIWRAGSPESARATLPLPDCRSPSSFNKIAHMTGLGRRAVRMVATDRDLKMNLDELAMRVAEDRNSGLAPFMVIGTAGTTAAGVIDPLPELARFCRSRGALVSRRRRVGRRGHPLAAAEALSRRNRRRRFDHLRRPQMVLRAHGCRNVLLPASGCRSPGVSRGFVLHASQDRRDGGRSVHHHRSVVAAVYRPQAVPGAGRARRSRLSPK